MAKEEIETKERKSIVPEKYAGKMNNDELAQFINNQCTGKEGFEFGAFFELCKANGLDESKVAHYKSLVDEKVQGGAGRARMTLRNMLAARARKEGKLKGLNGKNVTITMPVKEATGAAKAAKEKAAA